MSARIEWTTHATGRDGSVWEGSGTIPLDDWKEPHEIVPLLLGMTKGVNDISYDQAVPSPFGDTGYEISLTVRCVDDEAKAA